MMVNNFPTSPPFVRSVVSLKRGMTLFREFNDFSTLVKMERQWNQTEAVQTKAET